MFVVIFYNDETGFCVCSSMFKTEKDAVKYARKQDKIKRLYNNWKIFDLEND